MIELITQHPLFIADDSLFLIREFITRIIEDFKPDYLFMPVTSDLEPSWKIKVPAWMNSLYAPYTAFFMALRDYPRALAAIIDGTYIASQRDFESILDEFNTLYSIAMSLAGSGFPAGTLSVDEMIRLGALFYQVITSSDAVTGLVLDNMGALQNKWVGEPQIIRFAPKQAELYAAKLRDCYFTGIHWRQFLFQAMSEHKTERPAWVVNLSGIDVVDGDELWDFGLQSFVELLDFFGVLDSNRHLAVIICENDETVKAFLRKVYRKGFYLDEGALDERYLIITNRLIQ